MRGPNHFAALRQQKFGEVEAVLPADAGNESSPRSNLRMLSPAHEIRAAPKVVHSTAVVLTAQPQQSQSRHIKQLPGDESDNCRHHNMPASFACGHPAE